MKYMTSTEVRNTFLKFFEDKGHLIVPSSSLIPENDPSLLWINAGVAPLKKYFDGRDIPPKNSLKNYTRKPDVKKCSNYAIIILMILILLIFIYTILGY